MLFTNIERRNVQSVSVLLFVNVYILAFLYIVCLIDEFISYHSRFYYFFVQRQV